ncbi:MAG: hypothetical protein JWO82_4226 [Akkermansiaceae bacterium]|nr:hypothetical protein [Akkermansiaceae bacterium]
MTTTVISAPASAAVSRTGISLETVDQLWQFSETVAASGLAPKDVKTPEAIFVAIQMGFEVGLTPMAALQNIAVINGRPTLWGDAVLAVVRNTGELVAFSEWFEVAGKKVERPGADLPDDFTAVCRVQRHGQDAIEESFSVADAKKANLWTKDGPWKQYPKRMLKYRARAFALRDQFGDALRGLRSTEEVQDDPEPPMRDATPGADPGPQSESTSPKPRRARKTVTTEPAKETAPPGPSPVDVAFEVVLDPSPPGDRAFFEKVAVQRGFKSGGETPWTRWIVSYTTGGQYREAHTYSKTFGDIIDALEDGAEIFIQTEPTRDEKLKLTGIVLAEGGAA